MSMRIDSSVNLDRTNLRRPVDFVGRESEIRKVLDALAPSTRAWIISLTGVGGIGKTEIAIQAAHLARERKLFGGIVWTTAKESWLTHEGITNFIPDYALVSLNDLLNTIVEVLELDPRLYRLSPERKSQQVKEALAVDPCLLIVDNLETIQDRAVIQFLTELPEPSKALVTTRLGGLAASHTTVAQTLEGQREIRIGPMLEHDAIDLFLKRASAHDLHFSRGEHFAKLQEVVHKAAGIPLAIEWIIGQMALKGYPLDDALDRLRSSDGEVLKYCFENLIAAVGERAKKLLLAVPIFVQSASPDALLAITGIQRDKRDESLGRLTAASLVELEMDGRYSVLAPTRLYVSMLWREIPDLHESYCIKTATYYIQILRNAEQHGKWKSIEVEHHNILHILTWCFENGRYELVLQLAHAMSEYLQRLGLWDQRAYVCELGTQAASNLGEGTEAILFTRDAAEIHKHRGRLDQALDEFERCEEYSKETGNVVMSAHARMQMGVILYHKGKYTDSARSFRQSLEMHRANSDKSGEAMTLTLLGRNELKLGDLDEAKEYFQESLDIKKQIGDRLGTAISLYDLGHLHQRLGKLQMAERLLEEALEILNEVGDKRHQANAKWYYALLKIDCAQLEIARSLLTDVLVIEEELHRDTRVERTSAKLAEIEKAIAFGASARGIDESSGMQTSAGLRRILVIGIENYLHLSPVRGAIKDAQALSLALCGSTQPAQYQAVFLSQKEATCSAIRQHLKELSASSTVEQTTIILFVCHALRLAKRNYLCAYDTDLNDLDATAIGGLELAAIIRDIPSRDLVILLDCQHSLEPIPNQEALELLQSVDSGFSSKYLDYLASSTTAHILSSANEGEISHGFAHMTHRLFTHFMLKAIQGEACLRGNDLVYLLDLYYFVEGKVRENARDQNPQLYPQPGDSNLVLCPVCTTTSPSEETWPEAVNEVERQITNTVAKTKQFEIIEELRECIIKDPIEGAAQLSSYLADEDVELQNQVDLARTELLRIQADRERYGSIDPSSETQWQRCIFNLLNVCRRLLEVDILEETGEGKTVL